MVKAGRRAFQQKNKNCEKAHVIPITKSKANKLKVRKLSGPGGAEGAIMGVDIHHNRLQGLAQEPKNQDIYLRLWVKLHRFLARQRTPPSTRWC